MAPRKRHKSGSMKVWKSPVLYLGILLVVAVTGLLAAPFIIDWNAYRGDLEAYGRKLTGRDVIVEGPVSARLFPWPRLTIENLRIASPDGMDAKEFASAARLTVHMTLQGLLQGGIDVESIDIADPEVNFERMESGDSNWLLTPSADLVNSDILSRVKLDKITITGGTVNFHDHRRGETVTLDAINADVASPGVAGPWRMRARGVYQDKPVSVAVNTAAYVKGQPFLFGLKFQSADNSGDVYSFDGTYKGGFAEGTVQVAPAQAEDGKGDAEGKLRPLVFTAKAKGNFDQLDFDLSPGMEPVTITLEQGVTINGRVLDPEGKPVAGATVAPALTGTGNSLTGDTRFSVESNSRGEFTALLPASHDRDYNLIAHDGKYGQWRTWANAVLPPFRTRPGERREKVTLTLARPATVRGRLVDASGAPVTGREVRASAADRLENRYYDPTTTTGEDGTYTLRFLRPGEQFIQVAPFWLDARQAPAGMSHSVKLSGGETKEGVDFVLPAAGE